MTSASSSSSTEADAAIQLRVRKGSIAAPIVLTLLTIMLFVIHGLPSGFDQLGHSLGLTSSASEPLTFEKVAKAMDSSQTRNELLDRLSKFGPWDFVNKIIRPAVKIYIDQLFSDFAAISKSFLTTMVQLGLFALVPGLAGMFYRRNFTMWFAVGFAALFVINFSGLFGTLTTAQPMPGSGAIFFFILAQIMLLMMAYRLRRHAKGFEFLPARVQNWLLAAILFAIGVACWQGWGPGYKPPNPIPPSVAYNTPKPGEPPPIPMDPADEAKLDMANVGTRSWIWSFLGTGFTGWLYRWEFMLLGLPILYTLLRNSAAWTSRAPKNIVICLDGTSNTPDQMEMGFLAQTNVFKLFRMLKSDAKGMFDPVGKFDASLCKQYGDKQVGLYYAGVGNKYDGDPISQMLGMAAGRGAGEIVERAYLDLIRLYKPGDRVFIFGFSRGAAIARLLARTVDARGAPRSVWTLRIFRKHRTLWRSSRKQRLPIDVLGCWDTVGSFGVAKTIAGINFQQLNLFRDLTVPDNVAQAYHMVALDEQRAEFEPTLMDPDPIRPERIVEVWFAGDHANIGGGWATDKLSDITLDFLLTRVSSGYARDPSATPGDESWGIYLTALKADKSDVSPGTNAQGIMVVDPDPLGQVRHWFSNLYNYRPRKLPLYAVISETVFERMKTSMPVYAPQSLFDLNDALDAKRDLIEAKIGKLSETQSLEDLERAAVLAFKDKLRLTRWPSYWNDLVASRAPRAVELVLRNEIGTAPGSRAPAAEVAQATG